MSKHKYHEWWSESKRIEVVTSWLVLGNVPLVSAATGVPPGTIRQWKTQPWWAQLVQDVQTEADQELDAKLGKLVNKALEQVNDRLENGDFQYDPKTGKFIRVQMKGKDISKIAHEAIDKRFIIRKQTRDQVNQEAVADILKTLARDFADMARKQVKGKINGEVSEPETSGVQGSPEEDSERGLLEGGSGSDPSECLTESQPVSEEAQQSPKEG